MAEMTPLRRRMIEDMKVRNLSPATQRSYVHAVAKFAQHFNRPPDRLGLAEIRAYQIHLTSIGVSWAVFNVAVCALRFFYGVTLGRAAMVDRIPYARRAARTTGDPERRRGGALFLVGAKPEASNGVNDGLRRRAQGVRSRASEDHRHRQRPHADPGRTRQGRPGSLRHAVAATARCFARVLARSAAAALAVRQVGTRSGRLMRVRCSGRAETLAGQRSSVSRQPSIRSATASPPICSKPAPISARSRCCSVIATCRPQPAIPRSLPRRSATRSARSTGSSWKASRRPEPKRPWPLWRWRTSSAATARRIVRRMPVILAEHSAASWAR